MDIKLPDLSKTLDAMEERLERRIEIKGQRLTVKVALALLKDLEPDNAAYPQAQAILGL